MFGLGVPELLFIMVLALLVFGPKRLPHIGRTLGRGMAEFRKASTELQRGINLDLEDPPRRPDSKPSSPSDSGASWSRSTPTKSEPSTTARTEQSDGGATDATSDAATEPVGETSEDSVPQK